jgi:hypothetical protein
MKKQLAAACCVYALQVLSATCPGCKAASPAANSPADAAKFMAAHSGCNQQWQQHLQQQQQQQDPQHNHQQQTPHPQLHPCQPLRIQLTAALICIEVLSHILRQPQQLKNLSHLAMQLLLDNRMARITAAAGLRLSEVSMQQQLANLGRMHLWSWISAAPFHNSCVLLPEGKEELSSEARSLVCVLLRLQLLTRRGDRRRGCNKQDVLTALQQLLGRYGYWVGRRERQAAAAAAAGSSAAAAAASGDGSNAGRGAAGSSMHAAAAAAAGPNGDDAELRISEEFVTAWLQLRGLQLKHIVATAVCTTRWTST